MSHSEDDTSAIVSRYIEELLDRRADAVALSTRSDVPVLEKTPQRPLADEQFRAEMVSRFEQLRRLARETTTQSVDDRDVRRRARRRRLISLFIFAILLPILLTLLWNEVDAVPSESLPRWQIGERSAEEPVKQLAEPSVAESVEHEVGASEAVLEQPVSLERSLASGRNAQGRAHFWATVLDEARRSLHATAVAFAAPDASAAAGTQPAPARVARLLTEAVNDRILGSPIATRVARIEFEPAERTSRLEHHYVGDVLDASGHVVGRVSGSYTTRPESLSATILYDGDDRVEYGKNYFHDKLLSLPYSDSIQF